MLVKKNVGSKKNLGYKKFWSEIFWVKKILGRKFFGSNKISCRIAAQADNLQPAYSSREPGVQHTLFISKFCWLEMFLGKKKCGSEFFLGKK